MLCLAARSRSTLPHLARRWSILSMHMIVQRCARVSACASSLFLSRACPCSAAGPIGTEPLFFRESPRTNNPWLKMEWQREHRAPRHVEGVKRRGTKTRCPATRAHLKRRPTTLCEWVFCSSISAACR
jgi:hypothetical protein